MSLIFNHNGPYVSYYDRWVDDSAGNNDGHLDPGESVGLIMTLMNYGSTGATGVEVTLATPDPYVTLIDPTASYGYVGSGAVADNSGDPFLLEVAGYVPTAHVARFTLRATYVGGETISHFSLPIGQMHYLVWDPSPDASSGPVIHDTLGEIGYGGTYREELPIDALDRFMAIYISVGIYDSNYIIASGSAEALAITNYLNNGGCVYLEGGDVWYYDPQVGGHNFCGMFGICAQADGTGDFHAAVGQAGTITEGMNITYAGENNYMDHLQPTGTGLLIFQNSTPVYGAGILCQTATYKTIGVCFEFGGLQDGTSPSTKADLATAYMEFFMPEEAQAVREGVTSVGSLVSLSRVWPNPLLGTARFEYQLAARTDLKVGLYDIAGRCVRMLVDGERGAGQHVVSLDGQGLEAGVYFIRAHAPEATLTRRCVVAR